MTKRACLPKNRFSRRNSVAPQNDKVQRSILSLRGVRQHDVGVSALDSTAEIIVPSQIATPRCTRLAMTWGHRPTLSLRGVRQHDVGVSAFDSTAEIIVPNQIATPRPARLAMTGCSAPSCHSEECVSTTWESLHSTAQRK